MNQFENNDNELNSLLPYGENIRPLIVASTLSEFDLKFLLQKRGIFVKVHQRNITVPQIASILLSPKEFEILKNRQHQKESNIKRSTAQTEWSGGNTNIVDVLNQDLDEMVKKIVGENTPYSIHKFNITNVNSNKIIIEGEIKRSDWTKDVFSTTTYHPWKLIIEKLPNSNIIEYITETTVPETKELLNKLQSNVHNQFQLRKVVNGDKQIQKILATHFKKNQHIFEYLFEFTKQKYSSMTFERIVDIETGLDNKQTFPENFKWLRGNIGELRLTALKGKKLEETDIIEVGKIGILIFGEIDAEFKFSYPDANGICVIQFGFPKFYEKRNFIEFETKILKIELGSDCSHISKEGVKRYLLAEFQREKHKLFEEYKKTGKVDAEPKNLINQYAITYPWAG